MLFFETRFNGPVVWEPMSDDSVLTLLQCCPKQTYYSNYLFW